MIHVTITTQSSSDGLKKVQSILDTYFPRISETTWKGHIYKEGVSDIIKALNKYAKRKDVSVCMILNYGNKEDVIIIGDKKKYAQNGQIPVHVSKKKIFTVKETSFLSILKYILMLSAGFHDLGKISNGFQEMLRNTVSNKKSEAQPIRHEFLSIYILSELIIISDAKNDKEFFEKLSALELTKFISYITKAMSNIKDKIIKKNEPKSYSIKNNNTSNRHTKSHQILPCKKDFPLIYSISLLCLTHHRLPESDFDFDEPEEAELILKDGQHVRGGNDDLWQKFLEIDVKNISKNMDLWFSELQYDVKHLLNCIDKFHNEKNWFNMLFLIGRQILMIGDHDASKKKKPSYSVEQLPDMKHTFFANTVEFKGRYGHDKGDFLIAQEKGQVSESDTFIGSTLKPGYYLADTWQIHVHKVRRYTLLAYMTLLKRPQPLPYINENDIPPVLKYNSKNRKFSWQDDAVSIVSNDKEGYRHGGICFLLAGTGTGKTIASSKIMNAMSNGQLRYNACLGLRSLTLQTLDEYKESMGFKNDDISLIMGSQSSKLLHDYQKNKIAIVDQQEELNSHQENMISLELSMSASGTDAENMELDENIILGNEKSITNIPDLFKREISDDNKIDRRKMLFFTSPILVSTIDSLMSVADAQYGRHLLSFLRVATSDLIIDEIDSYNTEDFLAICRLIEISGAFGRRVIVASASMRIQHIQAIMNAYEEGFNSYKLLHNDTGKEIVGDYHMAIVSEFMSESNAASCFTDDNISSFLIKTSDMLIDNNRRKMNYINYQEDKYEQIISNIRTLHQDNYVEQNDVKLSVGLIRWNTVFKARECIIQLCQKIQQYEGMYFVFLCHHSNFPLIVKSEVDNLLAQMLRRKMDDTELDPIFNDAHIKEIIKNALKKDIKNIVIIISTTPLLEAGRDIDCDWAISEPCSERSLIQLAGRVRRHRTKSYDKTNIMLLNDKIENMQHPGILSHVRKSKNKEFMVSKMLPDLDINSSDFIQKKGQFINASPCLNPNMTIQSEAFEKELHDLLLMGQTKNFSKDDYYFIRNLSRYGYNVPDIRWGNVLPQSRTFRYKNKREDIEFRQVKNNWKTKDRHTIDNWKKTHNNLWEDCNSYMVKQDVTLSENSQWLFSDNVYNTLHQLRKINDICDISQSQEFELTTIRISVPYHYINSDKKNTILYNARMGLVQNRRMSS